jgi:hypothetical protein
MSYAAPLADMRFVLDEVAGIDEVARSLAKLQSSLKQCWRR